MKKITIAFFMLLTTIGFSQNDLKSSEVKTTYEEYNFLTERYGLEDGYSMMEGYELQDFMESTLEKFNFNYKLLVENSTKNVKAVFITLTKIKKKEDKIRYLCMPINNANLLEKFNSETTGLGVSMSIALDDLNQALISKLIDEKFNVNK